MVDLIIIGFNILTPIIRERERERERERDGVLALMICKTRKQTHTISRTEILFHLRLKHNNC
jgi:hypothetical protein